MQWPFYLEGLLSIIIASVCFVVGMVYIKNKTITFKKHYYESIKTSFRISLDRASNGSSLFLHLYIWIT
jgi:hypothetical protein